MGDPFNKSEPIYYQLLQRISRQIARGELQAEEKLPSVREMALQYGVNPNTVQRTYAEMEHMNIVESRRGLGTFVTGDKTRLVKLRQDMKNDHVMRFVNEMREIGFTDAEILDGVRETLKED